MKKYLAILVMALFILTSCGSNKNNNISNNNKKQEIKTNKEVQNKELFANTQVEGDVTEEDKAWIENLINLLNDKNYQGIVDILGGSAKDFAKGDPKRIENILLPYEVSGKIESIKNIKKEAGYDGVLRGYLFSIDTKCEKEDVSIIAAKGEDGSIFTLQKISEKVLKNQDKLKVQYSKQIEKSNQILNIVKEGKKDEFMKICETILADKNEVEKVFENLKKALETAGDSNGEEVLIGDREVTKEEAENIKGTKVVQIYMKKTYKNVNYIDFNFFFDDFGNLVSFNYEVIR